MKMLMTNSMISWKRLLEACVERHALLKEINTKKLTLREIKLENKRWITSELNILFTLIKIKPNTDSMQYKFVLSLLVVVLLPTF